MEYLNSDCYKATESCKHDTEKLTNRRRNTEAAIVCGVKYRRDTVDFFTDALKHIDTILAKHN